MTKVRHVAESGAVPSLVLAGVKTFPIARESLALRRELCSARLAVDGIQFLRIGTAVVIEYEIGIKL
jgi:hypothetical protein